MYGEAFGWDDVWNTEHKEEIVGNLEWFFFCHGKTEQITHTADVHLSLFKTPASLKTLSTGNKTVETWKVEFGVEIKLLVFLINIRILGQGTASVARC